MLINYGFKNFFSFREESFISFELDKNVPDSVRNGRDLSTLIGIKGANSSGKTNIIKVLSFLGEFVSSSSKKEKYKIPVSSFFGNSEPTLVYAEFLSGGMHYKYEVEISDHHVVSERISRKSKKWVPILLRGVNDVTDTIAELSLAKTIRLTDNASVVSTLSNFKFFDSLIDLKNIHQFFLYIGVNVNVSSGMYGMRDDFRDSSGLYFHNDQIFGFVREFLLAIDMGIKDIEIVQDVDSQGEEYFKPIFKHVNADRTYELLYRDQSSGTKYLYRALGLYWACLNAGSVLALDEFDTHLHSYLLPLILNLFESPETNPKGAQLIFTSHNTEIIDKLGKYRTVLVNKEESESYCYRLDEIEGSILRNDRPISPVYAKGLIGGVPVI